MKTQDQFKNDKDVPAILFIDDEKNILSAITRALRPHPFQVFVAFGWEDAELILAKNAITVAICDRNLRGSISGIQILEKLRSKFPDIVRIMLSGDIKVESVLSSINRGHVYRFVPKPWNLDELISAINDGISLHILYTERNTFEKELIALNMSLEERVIQSTQAMSILYSDLEQSFDKTIGVLLSILALHSNLCVAHVKRTAARVANLCLLLDVSPTMTRIAKRAALLHWTGLTSVSSTFFESHLWAMELSAKPVWEFHSLLGQQALLPVPALQVERAVIANYQRPDLAPVKIRFVCQILAASSFFEHALYVVRRGRKRIDKREFDALHERFKKEYSFLDSVVLHALFSGEKGKVRDRIESQCEVQALRKGMVLSRSITSGHGIPLVPAEIVIDNELIETLKEYSDGISSVYVWDDKL